MAKNFSPCHILPYSPWPILVSFSLGNLAISSIALMHNLANANITLCLSYYMTLIFIWNWFRDILRESLYLGLHSKKTKSAFSNGFLLFMVSETFFFATFIWAYFYIALSPTVHLGATWPPLGISPINPWTLPLLNTVLLLSSGATATWAHNAILAKDLFNAIKGLLLTVTLGTLFTLAQLHEYKYAPFNLTDSVFGTLFFSTVSLHGIHVLIGTIFLLLCLYRLITYQFSNIQHIMLEAALIYWHIVDIIFLILFTSFYIWVYV